MPFCQIAQLIKIITKIKNNSIKYGFILIFDSVYPNNVRIIVV